MRAPNNNIQKQAHKYLSFGNYRSNAEVEVTQSSKTTNKVETCDDSLDHIDENGDDNIGENDQSLVNLAN